MFGDHQPNDYVVEPLYTMKGKKASELKGAEHFERYKVPVICSQGYMGADGKYRDLETLDDYIKNINDYRILNYYNLFGDSAK